MFNKYSRYKEIIIVDCENVGCGCVKNVTKDTYIILCIRCESYKCLDRCINGMKNVEVVNVYDAQREGVSIGKNALDFCVVSQVSYVCSRIPKKCTVTILSKDHGFDIAIYRLKQLYHHPKIQRIELGVEEYLIRRGDLAPGFNDNALEEVFDEGNMEQYVQEFLDYKRTLTASKKKELQVCKHQNTKSVATIIEHNPIRDCYFLVYSGVYQKMARTVDGLNEDFKKCKKIAR